MHPGLRAAVLVTLLLVLGLLAPAARGDVEGSVPDATAFTTQRKVVRFSDGSLALAYVVQIGGSNRVQVARSTGGVVWSPLDPPSLSGSIADRPALAVDSGDGLHLAWTANDTAGRQVFYAGYADGRWSAGEKVSETQGYSGFPSIAVDSRNRVHVAWYGFDGTFYQVYYRVRTATGWGPQVAVTAQSADATNPAIAIDGADSVHVVWYHLDSRGTGYQVSYARVAGNPILVETISSGEDAVDPTMAIDRTGQVLVAWTSSGVASRIALAIKGSEGWSVPTRITPAALVATHPSIALDDAGTPYLFFEGGDRNVYYQREANGTWETPQALTASGNNSYPSARWSFYPLRAPAGAPTVDVIWTEAASGSAAVRFAGLAGASGPSSLQRATSPADLAFFGGLLAVFAGLIILGWPRRPKL